MSAVLDTALMSRDELAAHDASLVDVLISSVYPGAKRESAGLVIAYCRAAGLDPIQKPVHIVPMSVKKGTQDRYGNDEYETRDVIMPGIGLYRVQAARTGQYAGQDAPVIGPMKTLTYQTRKREWVEVPGRDRRQPRDTWVQKSLEYPEWVEVTVYRLVGGYRSPFTARELWTENYATAGRDSEAPNAMWERRTVGQLVKCAEAQALRKGFPEVGSQPTAEELEGKTIIEVEQHDAEPRVIDLPRRLSDATAEQEAARAAVTPAAATVPEESAPVEPGSTRQQDAPPAAQHVPAGGDPASEGERKNIVITARARKVNLAALLDDMGLSLDAETLDGLTKPMFKAIKARLQ